MSEPVFKFSWGEPVRFIGGKYNGFEGNVRWCGETTASVVIVHENKPCEVVEDVQFLQNLAQWKSTKSQTELALKSQ